MSSNSIFMLHSKQVNGVYCFVSFGNQKTTDRLNSGRSAYDHFPHLKSLCFDIGPIYRSLVQISILQKYKMVIQDIEQGPPRFIEIKLLYKFEHH